VYPIEVLEVKEGQMYKKVLSSALKPHAFFNFKASMYFQNLHHKFLIFHLLLQQDHLNDITKSSEVRPAIAAVSSFHVLHVDSFTVVRICGI